MYAKSFSILALAAASLVAADDFTVATPPYVQQCSPLKISWQGGEPPYQPHITGPGDIRDVKENLDETSDTSTKWTVTIPEGQEFTINVCDNSGQCRASGKVGPVGKGDDKCLNGGGSKGGSSGGGGAAAGGGGSSGGDDKKSSGGDDNKSSSGGDDKKSSSSSDNKSSSSSGGKSSSSSGQSSTGGGSGGGSSSAQPSSTGAGGGSGSDDKSGQDNKGGEQDSDNKGDDEEGKNGAMSFSGVPAVVAGVVGVVVAALI